MSELPRLYIRVDRLSLQEIDKHLPPSGGSNYRSLWLAMEDLAFKQNGEHPGRSFRTSHNYLATVGKVSVSTVKRVCNYFEEIGLLTITNRKTRGCRFDLNLYTLKYPKLSVAPTKLRLRSSTKPTINKLDIQRGMASMPPVPSPLALRGIDAMPEKEQTEAMDAEVAAKYKPEQLATAEERRRQQDVELCERQERERIEYEEHLTQLREWTRLAKEKEKADEEAAKLAQDARRLAMRTDVGSCVAAIREAVFDEYDPGTLPSVLTDFDRSTFYAAVGRLQPELSNKVSAVMKRCPWDF